jgi:hypothetical protein
MGEVNETGTTPGSSVASAHPVNQGLSDEAKPAKMPLPQSMGQGSAVGAGGHLPGVPKQPTKKADSANAATAPARTWLDLSKIDAAYVRLVQATKDLQVATKKSSREAYSTAAAALSKADLQFRQAINDEVTRVAQRSLISPGKPHGGHIRELEVRIILAYGAEPEKHAYVRAAVSTNRMDRLALELRDLSDAVTAHIGEFSPEQRTEADAILADAANWVAEPREKFYRLEELLKRVTKAMEPLEDVTKSVRKFEPARRPVALHYSQVFGWAEYYSGLSHFEGNRGCGPRGCAPDQRRILSGPGARPASPIDHRNEKRDQQYRFA